ncbi:MAG: PQQ-dependent sugar dehydrogenase [Actinomycetota bacterium]|nr:PQQ-dependent sugar dehydrogenase [Actinomycetota bacterium]
MIRLAACLVALVVLAACDVTPAQGQGVRLVSIGSFEQPLYVTAPPGDRRRVFVVEQEGRIMVVRDGRKLAEPFLDIRSLVDAGGERGLLSMAFAPDYAQTGRFYVYYTDNRGHTRVVEYGRATEERADPGSARLVLFQRQPEPNHNGGLVLFGPDRLLYIGLGDGGGGGDRHGPRGNGQNLGTWLGKILRIDPRASRGRPFSVPAANPFVRRRGARPEIYAYGLRNPWRFSFDRANGDMTIADVGQDAVEEVSFRRRGRARGANFGWRVFEGRSRFARGESAPGAVFPVIERRHSQGSCSITGGVISRDPAVPALRGRYLFSDFCDNRILTSRLSGRGASRVRVTGVKVDSPSSFGEDAQGRVYVTSLAGGVFRFTAR